MRRLSPYAGRRGDTQVLMAPLINVVFLLLIFFVGVRGVPIAEHVLRTQVSPPSAAEQVASRGDRAPSPEADFPDMVVRVLWHEGRPQWQVNDQPLATLTELRRKLEAVFEVLPTAPLMIDPDDNTPLGSVIEVYDLTRQVGFKKVRFVVAEDV